MKIAMISELAIGGGRRHTLTLANDLRRLGNDVKIISFGKRDICNYFSLPALPLTSHYKLLPDKKKLFSLLEKQKPDLIHIHHPVGSIDFLLKKLKERFKKPIVSTIHQSTAGTSFIDRTITYYFKIISKGFKHSDKIICVSDFVKRNFKKVSGISEKNLVVIPNGVDTKKFRPLDNKSKDFKILFVGRLAMEKGLSVLFKSFELLNEGKLYIIGDGPLKLECKIKAKNNENIRFLGRVSDNVLVKNYSSANLAIFPSLWQEAFGMVIIEAMACGTPPMTFKVGGIPEIIKDKYNGFLVNKKTPEALSARILEAKNMDLEKIGKGGRETVVKKYKWEKIAKETLKLYNSLI